MYDNSMLRLGVLLALVVVGFCIPLYPAAASPLVAVVALIGGQATLALLLVVPCVLKRRVFCRFVCPLGLCFDTIGRWRKNRLPQSFRKFPRIGIYLTLLTLLGSTVGGFGFLWLDPLVLFASPIRGNIWLLSILGVIFVSAWFLPTFWCRTVCPLGGMQDALYAPKSLLAQPKTVIHIDRRRSLLRLGILVALFGGMFGFLRRRVSANGPLRPPGAVPEPFFLALCARCGTCIKVCPTKLLATCCGEASALDWGMPRLQFDPAWCRDDCIVCTQNCPSGALRRIEPDEKKNVKIGLAVFEFEYCRLYEDIECTHCGRDCPFEAITFEWSEEEYRRIVYIDAERCTGCGRCLVSCPVKHELPMRPLRIVKET